MAKLSVFLRTEDNAIGSGLTVYATVAALPTTGLQVGDQAFVTANNNIYVWNGNGWYTVATVNQTPTWSTAPDSTYSITDGQALAITLEATDPDGFPLTYSYSTSGLSNYATVAQSGTDNRTYTITPLNAGSFTVTFTASDGINVLSSTSSFSMLFIIQHSAGSSFLLKATGTGQNQSPTDASASSHTITANGSTTLGSFSPYRDMGYSIRIENGEWLSAASSSSDFAAGTGEFTLECWIWKEGTGDAMIFDTVSPGSTGGTAGRFAAFINNDGGVEKMAYYVAGTGIVNGSATETLDLYRWHHIAWVRSSGTIKMYLDGVEVGSTSQTTNLTQSNLRIGRDAASGGTSNLVGYIYDFRYVKGSAVYTSEFDVPTAPLTAITNTKLLLGGPGINDKSDSRHIFTPQNAPSAQPWTPFDRETYTTTGHAGSAHFDGNGDYLQIADNADFDLAGEFAYEFWLYRTGSTSGTYQAILGSNGSGSNGLTFYITQSNGALGVFQSSFIISGSAGDIKDQVWHHVLLMRDSSNLLQLFIDGNRVSSSTNTTTFSDNSAGSGTRIGYDIGANGYFEGFLSDIRLVKGSTGGYSSGATITVPTSPLTAVTNTKLLLNMGQAGLYDATTSRHVNITGNVAGSATQQKYSGKNSIRLSGTGNYLKLDATPEIDFPAADLKGAGDFTIELHHYLESRISTKPTFWGNYTSHTGGALAMFAGHATGSTTQYQVAYNGHSFPQMQGGTIVYDAWKHLALVRAHGVMRLFLDGTQIAERADSVAAISSNGGSHWIGASGDGVNEVLDGYIQDFRITKDLARYPYVATPKTLSQTNSGLQKPDATFPSATASNTILLACHTSNPVTEGSSGGYTFTNNNSVAETTTKMPIGAPTGMTGMQFTASSSMYLENNNSEIPALSTGDWTIEYWVWHDTLTADQTHLAVHQFHPSILYDHSASKWSIYNGAHHYITTVTPEANKWYHFAWVHNDTDGKLRVFVNGTLAQEHTENFNVSGQRYYIGRDSSGKYMNGTISNLRIVKGQALYSNSFTAPATEFNG